MLLFCRFAIDWENKRSLTPKTKGFWKKHKRKRRKKQLSQKRPPKERPPVSTRRARRIRRETLSVLQLQWEQDTDSENEEDFLARFKKDYKTDWCIEDTQEEKQNADRYAEI